MQFLNIIIAILIGSFFIWRLYKYVKNDPKAFSGENMGKSFYTMGILGIVLAAAVYFVIVLLKG